MIEVVTLGELGQTVVDGVSGGQAAALEADTAQVGVGLYDVLHRLGAEPLLHRQLGLVAIGQQCLVTELGDGLGRQGRGTTGHGLATGDLVGPRLEVGGERIPHAGDQQPHWGPGDDAGIHDDHIGVGRDHQVFAELPLWGVDDRQRTGWRIGGGDGRHYDHRHLLVEGDRLGGIERLAATYADDDVERRLVAAGQQAVDLGAGAFAVEAVELGLDAHAVEAGGNRVANQLGDEGIGQNERLGTECLDVVADIGEGPVALHVFAGADDDAVHILSLSLVHKTSFETNRGEGAAVPGSPSSLSGAAAG
ncbi:hypothetical protein AERO9A_420083 [Aeromonas salmonicida]|nr:hypothetical protein AERO9A_420083 [Aeromonas salmonicida]